MSETADRGTWRSILGRLIRGLFLLVGLSVLGVGLLVVFVPETEGRLPIEAILSALGSDYVVVAVVGVSAVGLAVLVVVARRIRGVDEASPPPVEGVLSAAYPGSAFDARTRASREDRRERLREAAIRATMRSSGCSRGVAEQRVADGDWIDDETAARYLSDGDAGGMSGWFDWGMRGGDRAVSRTVDAIERVSNGDRPARADDQAAARSTTPGERP
ncbi:hypothetical protein [Natronomonas sp.]|uniref:DUF7269 family protein n=1 Tax=Natronomonas sp. TaxID=2184060 RepID=UPI003974738D